MSRQFFLHLAAAGLRMPIAADLTLHEQPDPEAVREDGAALGRVVETTARRWGTPLAIPLMDLRLEEPDSLASPRRRARLEALRYIAAATDLLPVGISLGPFSLLTRLLPDPITVLALAGRGDAEALAAATTCLARAEAAVARSIADQIEAGARALLLCEPAAGVAYLSPRQPALFEQFVLQPNLRLRPAVDLIFHDCGELTARMVQAFAARLHPVMLSLGSSRRLWEDAAVVPRDVVLYGNLPTKLFYSDAAMPDARVAELAAELGSRMSAIGHPHILGSECDVLSVQEGDAAIRRKLACFLAPGNPGITGSTSQMV